MAADCQWSIGHQQARPQGWRRRQHVSCCSITSLVQLTIFHLIVYIGAQNSSRDWRKSYLHAHYNNNNDNTLPMYQWMLNKWNLYLSQQTCVNHCFVTWPWNSSQLCLVNYACLKIWKWYFNPKRIMFCVKFGCKRSALTLTEWSMQTLNF